MMKKGIGLSISLLLLVGSLIPVFAEIDFTGKEDEYTALCSSPKMELTDQEKKECGEFLQYLSDQSGDLKTKLDDLEKQRKDIAKNIVEYIKKIQGYTAKIENLAKEIAVLNTEISVKVEEIKLKEVVILEKEDEVEGLREQIKHRMVAAQSSMRLNKYLDIIMGAKDLNDLIRRTNGLKDIANYDEKTRIELKGLIDELKIEKEELEKTKQELEVAKESVVKKRNESLVLREQAEIVKEELEKQEADIEAEGNRIASDYEALKALAKEISANIDKIPNSSGFTRPISGGRITANTWYYPSGGVHLGIDYGAPIGTSVRAAGNGFVLKSVSGCPYGAIGNSCGAAQGGSSGGGNQVYLLTKINNTLYAVKYLHLLDKTPIAQGSIVSAGDTIAKLGSSGNSSGPHVHVEVFKLGTMSINEYIESWKGDLAFGAGWGSSALSKTCDKVGTPCRVRPESVFE